MLAATDKRIARFRRPLGWLLAVYWIALFVSTHVPLPKLSNLPRHADKWAHLITYGGLGFLLALWWSTRWPLGRRQLGIALAVLAGYGVVDELLQIPVNRHADIYDVLADVCGAIIGLAAFVLVRKLLPRGWGVAAGGGGALRSRSPRDNG